MFFKFIAYDKEWNVEPVNTRYFHGHTLAVVLTTETDEIFASLTVNLPESPLYANDRRAFVDTNNCPWAEKFLEDTGIARKTDITSRSGYCTYPLYEFDLTKLVQEVPYDE